MTRDSIPSETLLTRLKAQIALSREMEMGVVLLPDEAEALVECAGTLKAYRNKSDWHEMKKAALAKLEAL